MTDKEKWGLLYKGGVKFRYNNIAHEGVLISQPIKPYAPRVEFRSSEEGINPVYVSLTDVMLAMGIKIEPAFLWCEDSVNE